MSILYPHLLARRRAPSRVLFTRVLNPIWTYPDGYSWLRALRDEQQVGLHAALTPTWSETAWWADYVLPMGHGPERHDTHSYETHAGRWLGFRQPVQRVAMERMGKPVAVHLRGQPRRGVGGGRVLDRALLARRPRRLAGHPPATTSRPTAPARRSRSRSTTAGCSRTRCRGCRRRPPPRASPARVHAHVTACVEIASDEYGQHEAPVDEPDGDRDSRARGDRHQGSRSTARICRSPDARTRSRRSSTASPRRGFNTPSRKLELYSETLAEWGWPEFATPTYARTHVHHSLIDHDQRRVRAAADLPAADDDPLALGQRQVPQRARAHPPPARLPRGRRADRPSRTGDLVRVETEIGYFVIKALVTEGIRPGVVAASHHMGRWRLHEDRRDGALVLRARRHDRGRTTAVTLPPAPRRAALEVRPTRAPRRVWWNDAGVHQNITFPVHPDPISGMHCWHQKVRVRPAAAPATAMPTSTSTSPRAATCTASGSRSRDPRAASCADRSGCSARSNPSSTPTSCPRTPER